MVRSLQERIVTVAQRRARSESSLNELAQTLAAEPTPWRLEAADMAVEAQISVLRQAREHLSDLQVALAAAITDEEGARQRLAVAEAERERVVSMSESARRAVTDALEAWRMVGMDGLPSRDAIERREDALARRAAELAGQLEEERALASAYEVLLAQEQLATLTVAMEAEGGAGAADDPSAHEQRLQARLNGARAALRVIEEARKAVVAYAEQLRTMAEDFSSKFLLPLNDLIDAFNRALLSTPGESVQFNAAHTVERTSLGMQLRYADPIENARYRTELPPQLVLSEGQMAANGFSILCAASTAYRWSRWRALLLDDPLQHNDIIHAAAFVDVMRNLVEIEGYQLVMSSHKRDEGEFIARKFDAAGLPCTVVALTAASTDGVKFDPSRHNAAARRLLGSLEAKLA